MLSFGAGLVVVAHATPDLRAAAKKQPPPAAKSKKPAGEKPEESGSAKAGAAHGHGHGHRHGHGKGHGHPRQGDKHAHDAAPASAEVWLLLLYGCLWRYSWRQVAHCDAPKSVLFTAAARLVMMLSGRHKPNQNPDRVECVAL
jgi:hypothetical protein